MDLFSVIALDVFRIGNRGVGVCVLGVKIERRMQPWRRDSAVQLVGIRRVEGGRQVRVDLRIGTVHGTGGSRRLVDTLGCYVLVR